MKIIAGVDIGNSTTEVCIGSLDDTGHLRFLSSASCMTTGLKGTKENVKGISLALNEAAHLATIHISGISCICINEAAPVIGGTAMETITETIVTDSAMLGHNPNTPAGAGTAVGILKNIEDLDNCQIGETYIVTVSTKFGFEKTAQIINSYAEKIDISGLILQADEAVLVYNRLNKKIPVIDEVRKIEKLRNGVLAAIEVALVGETVRMLSNPFGIATLISLSPNETKTVVPIAKSLIGSRSAAVVKTPHGNVTERKVPAGIMMLENIDGERFSVPIDNGAEMIMQTLKQAGELKDVYGQAKTNIGIMLENIKAENIAVIEMSEKPRITDVLAVDTMRPIPISGGLSDETVLQKAVGVAAMVKTGKLPIESLAAELQKNLGICTRVAGVEAVMASLGAFTTPGASLPFAVLDLGGGSTDAAVLDNKGKVISVHLAGAGALVTLLIQAELSILDQSLAEYIKIYPLAKVESLFHIRLETGELRFFDKPLHPRYFGKVVITQKEEWIPVELDSPMEKIAFIRKEAKRKVFAENAIRALTKIAPDNNIKNIPNVILVGGSAEDFEIPNMLTEVFFEYGIVCGRGNVRKIEGARNAVATGLLMSYAGGRVEYANE